LFKGEGIVYFDIKLNKLPKLIDPQP